VNTDLVTAPSTLPVTVAELRRHVWEVYDRDATDDTYFTELLARATDHVETITSRKLVSQTWRGYLDAWPDGGAAIELPFGRVISITRFNWLGEDAVDHTMTASTHYIASLAGYWPKVVAVTAWPTGALFPVDPIRIEFVAGFGAAAVVPAGLKQAILMLAAHWYKNREIVRVGNIVSSLPHAFDHLVGPWRIRGV
jgi:uncharacterized phiE125 gp8 family phage protein